MILNRILVQTVFLCHIALSGDVEAQISPNDQSAVSRPITPQSPRREETKPSEVASSLLVALPEDLSSHIGQYLEGNKGDLWKLRRASRHFNRLHDDPSRFQPLKSLFDQHQDLESERYQSLDDLLESVRCVPDVYVDVRDIKGMHSLPEMHHFFRAEILRGLTKGGKQPFLSFYFWDEKTLSRSLEVLCVFKNYGLTVVKSTVVEYDRFYEGGRKPSVPWEYSLTESESRFNVRKLRDVMNSGKLDYLNKRWILCNRNKEVRSRQSAACAVKILCCVCASMLCAFVFYLMSLWAKAEGKALGYL